MTDTRHDDHNAYLWDRSAPADADAVGQVLQRTDATREWMLALYAARTGGATSPAAALESASRTILTRRRSGGQSTHPFYWAAFCASGE